MADANSSRQDFVAGLLFVTIGAVGAVVANGYSIGTASRMGPGYFPLLVSGLLVAVGCILLVRHIAAASQISLGDLLLVDWRTGIRALLVVLACIVAFAALIERGGLAITSLVCVSIAYFGARRLMEKKGSVLEGVSVALALSAFSIFVFVYAIGLPIRVWPT